MRNTKRSPCIAPTARRSPGKHAQQSTAALRVAETLLAKPAGAPNNFVLRHAEAWRPRSAPPSERPHLAVVENRNTA